MLWTGTRELSVVLLIAET